MARIEGTVTTLQRFPVKGLSAEPLERVTLTMGRPFPGDRLFAIENGDSGYDPHHPVHQPKSKYLELMRNPRLSALATSYDASTGVLTIAQGGRVVAAGSLATAEGRAVIESFMRAFVPDELRGPPRVLTGGQGYQFMDSARSGHVSLLGNASVRALSALAGRQQLDPGRFRMNIGLDGVPPFGEQDWIDKIIRIGTARLRVVKATERCVAIDVAPGSGTRDTTLLPLMQQRMGHRNCGVYAHVIETGDVQIGDAIILEQPSLL